MAKAARRGLDMRKKQSPSNRGGTSVGLARARQLVSRQTISPDVVKRMFSFFSRHEVDKSSASWKKGNSKGEQAWLLWGGDAGFSWSRKVVKQMEAADKKANNSLEVNVVKKDGSFWYVYSEEGKKLSKGYLSKKKAEARLKQIEAFKHMKNVRVNILSTVNADSIKIERKGDLAIIKNYRWHIDDVVLNGGLYPKDENEKGYMSMNGRLAPAGHPRSGDKYVAISNLDNEDATKALADHYIGARTLNVRKSGNNYYCDIEVNTKLAKASNDGNMVVNWIDSAEKYLAGNGEKPKNIHTSTGLNTIRVNEEGDSRGKHYTWRATNQQYDHLSILPNEIGAGGDELSLSVNADGEECEVINCQLDEFEGINNTKSSIFNKIIAYMVNGDERSFEKTISLLSTAIREKYSTYENKWAWVVEVYNDYLIFEVSGEYRKIAYKIDLRDNVDLVGDYEVVKREVTYSPVTNQKDTSHMSKFLEALNEAGIDTKDMTDDQVFYAYNAMMDDKSKEKKDDEDKEKKEEGKAMNQQLETLLNEVNSLKSQIAANADEKLKPIREAVKNSMDMSDEEVNALPESALNKLYAKSQPAAGLLPGRMQSNSSESVFNSDYSFGDE
jgi:hypothetical protein